ncbi:MAG: HRDC domain-containing protein [Planctomycetaceae bacterium]|nr:HRDC domain-containing protein [Planctomycetaceae bacterium]
MSYFHVTTSEQLHHLLEQMYPSAWVGFDTEFISEGRYQSQLCLVQVAYDQGLAIIDPTTVSDLKPFWSLLCDGRREVIVHAGRSELEFCYRAIQKLPEWFFDVQVAAGFVGTEYPLGFRDLVEKYLGVKVSKGETRTDWLKRPLSPRQIDYALNDVRYLFDLTKILRKKLKERDRFVWYHGESTQTTYRLQREMEIPKWRSTAKCSALPPRQQAIVRELWFWRDRVAKKQNQISARILRDDLIVEIAKLESSEIARFESIRGLNRPDLVRQYGDIKRTIDRALTLDRSELPELGEKQLYPQYTVMVQFLYTAFNMTCKKYGFSTQLVGTQVDIREMIAHLYQTLPEGIIPRLTRGWRLQLVGCLLEDLINGKLSMKLNRNHPEEPIEFIENGEP